MEAQQMKGEMSVKANVYMQNIDIDKFAHELVKTQFCPANYRDRPLDVKFAILWGAELGLSAFQSITGVKVINGKPSLHGDILLAVCRKNPEWEDMIESYDEATKTGYCEVRRKGHEPMIRSFSWAQADKAGLIQRNPVYKSYPERMLQHRARGFALRDMYADSLCGMIGDAEASDYPQSEATPSKDITPQAQAVYANGAPMPDFEAEHHVAEIGQMFLKDDKRRARQMAKDMSPELKKRVWPMLSDEYKQFIKDSIEAVKPIEVTPDV